MKAKVSKRVSLYKTITWRVIASLTTFLLTWAVTGELEAGLVVGGFEAVLKMIFYYWHERVWARFYTANVNTESTS